jgi:hypothetical protein
LPMYRTICVAAALASMIGVAPIAAGEPLRAMHNR